MPSEPTGRNAVTRQVFLGGAAAGLAGLGRSGRSRATRSLTLWSYAQGEDFVTWLNGQVAAFQRAYPFLRVTVVTKDPATQHDDLSGAQTAGATPDLCLMDAALLGSFASKGALVSLERFPDFADLAGLYVPSYLEATRFAGRVYGLPINAQPYVLAGNRTLLGQRPLPRDWQELVSVARQVTKSAAGIYGFSFPGGGAADTADRFTAWLLSGGGRILSPDGREPAFNGPAGVGALELLMRLQRSGAMQPDGVSGTVRDSMGSFIRNESALTCEGPWVQSIMVRYGGGSATPLELGPLPVAAPALEAHAPATLLTLMTICMWSATAAPSAAWALLKFLRDEKADLAFTSGAQGGVPVVASAYRAGVKWAMVGKEAFRQAAQSVQIWPAVPQLPFVQAQIGAAVSAALSGGRLSAARPGRCGPGGGPSPC